MSLLDKQRELENAPDSFLQQLLQRGDKQYPAWLVHTVADARADMRQRFQNQEALAQAEQPKIVDKTIAKLGGIPDVDPNQAGGDPSLATGIAGGMARGGVVKGYHEGKGIEPHTTHRTNLAYGDDSDADEAALSAMEIEEGAVREGIGAARGRLEQFERDAREWVGSERRAGRIVGLEDYPAHLKEVESTAASIRRMSPGWDMGADVIREMSPEQQRGWDALLAGAKSGAEYRDIELQMNAPVQAGASRLKRARDPEEYVPFSAESVLGLDDIYADTYRPEEDEQEETTDEEDAKELMEWIESLGMGTDPRLGPTQADMYAKIESEIGDFEKLMTTRQPADDELDRIRKEIAEKKYEQARGIGTLDRERLTEMEGLLDRRLYAGRGRIGDLERLEETRKAGEKLGFESSFMADIADALRGRKSFSDVSRGARTFGEEMTEQEKEALQAIYDEETSLLETEDTALGNQYNLRRQIETEEDEAELILDNVDEVIAQADAQRTRAGAAEIMNAYVSLWRSQAEQIGLDARTAQEIESAMRTAQITSENEMMDSTKHEAIRNRLDDARRIFANDPDKIKLINDSEKFIMGTWLMHSTDAMEGVKVNPDGTIGVKRVEDVRVPAVEDIPVFPSDPR